MLFFNAGACATKRPVNNYYSSPLAKGSGVVETRPGVHYTLKAFPAAKWYTKRLYTTAVKYVVNEPELSPY
jgi:hypothetical protein